MTRRALARQLRVDPRVLRHWEGSGVLPRFGAFAWQDYRDRAVLILAGRRRLTMQRLRRALAVGEVLNANGSR